MMIFKVLLNTIACQHQQVLCSKKLNSDELTNFPIQILHSIRGSSLQGHRFRALLEEYESDFEESFIHTDVRWLRHASF